MATDDGYQGGQDGWKEQIVDEIFLKMDEKIKESTKRSVTYSKSFVKRRIPTEVFLLRVKIMWIRIIQVEPTMVRISCLPDERQQGMFNLSSCLTLSEFTRRSRTLRSLESPRKSSRISWIVLHTYTIIPKLVTSPKSSVATFNTGRGNISTRSAKAPLHDSGLAHAEGKDQL